MSTVPNQADVDALRGLLDLMANFESNDQRARFLLSSNWMRDRDAATKTAATVNALEDAADAIIVPGASSVAAKWLRERAALLALRAGEQS